VLRYIVTRLLQTIITLWILTLIVFSLTRISGNPVDTLLPLEASEEHRARISKLWGLDKPLIQQYYTFMSNISRGELGTSLKWQQPVAGLIWGRFPNTLALAAFSIAIGTLIAVPIGVLSAVRRGSVFDYVARTVALLGQSVPPFWLGLMVMWVFAVQLELVSPAGKEGFASFLLPGMALSLAWIASIIRILRSSMLDVLDSEYIRLARVKGLPEWKVISKHALRNAAIGPLTYFGLILGSLLAGSVSIETVFDWPGLGPLAVEAAMVRDYPLIQGVVLLFGALFLMINLLVDILYVYLDPRVRYA